MIHQLNINGKGGNEEMRLINADALLIDYKRACELIGDEIDYTAITCIDNAPTEDVEPVRHGEWQITEAYPHNVYCSECHTKFAQTHWQVWEDGSLPRNYCPYCGAKMYEE